MRLSTRPPACLFAFAACLALAAAGVAGCVDRGVTATVDGGTAGAVAVSGQIFIPSAGAPARAAAAGVTPFPGALVVLGPLTGTTDSRGRFSLATDAYIPGLRDLQISGGRLELHVAVLVRVREQLLLKIQYDAGTQRVYVTETRIECPATGTAVARTTVKAGLAAAAGAVPAEIAAAGACELPTTFTPSQARDKIIAQILIAESAAERAESIDLVGDPSELVDAVDLRYRPSLW